MNPLFRERIECCHHWIINPAEGPTSQGVCKNCGEIKEFENHVIIPDGWSSWRGSPLPIQAQEK